MRQYVHADAHGVSGVANNAKDPIETTPKAMHLVNGEHEILNKLIDWRFSVSRIQCELMRITFTRARQVPLLSMLQTPPCVIVHRDKCIVLRAKMSATSAGHVHPEEDKVIQQSSRHARSL